MQVFGPAGIRTGGFTRPGRLAGRVAIGSLVLSGVGSLIYEFLQPALRTGIFDWTDVLFVLFGTGIGWLAVRAILGYPGALLRSNPSMKRP